MDYFLNCSLFLCAFIPLYILIIIKTLIDIAFNNLSFNHLNTCMLIFLSILIIVGLSGLLISTNKSKNKTKNINIISAKNITDQHFLNYFSIFVLFAITFDLSKVSYSAVFILILTFIAIVYIKNNLYHINPFLNIIGFSFFEITYTHENSNQIKTGTVFCRHKIMKHNLQIVYQATANLWFIKN